MGASTAGADLPARGPHWTTSSILHLIPRPPALATVRSPLFQYTHASMAHFKRRPPIGVQARLVSGLSLILPCRPPAAWRFLRKMASYSDYLLLPPSGRWPSQHFGGFGFVAASKLQVHVDW